MPGLRGHGLRSSSPEGHLTPSNRSEDDGRRGSGRFTSFGHLFRARVDDSVVPHNLGPRSGASGGGRRATNVDAMWSGPGAGMPVHERNTGDDLFADSGWLEPVAPRRSSLWRLAGVENYISGGGRGLRNETEEPTNADRMFGLDEPLLANDAQRGHIARGWRRCWRRHRDEGQKRTSLCPTMRAVTCAALALLLVIAMVFAVFGSQLIQLAVGSSELRFVAVNISLPPPRAHTKNVGHSDPMSEVANIGFDSLVDISSAALWLWPWTVTVTGGNFTLDFCLRPGVHGGDGGGDGRYQPCTVGGLFLPPISLQGGRGAVRGVSLVGGELRAASDSECFRGFTRGILLEDTLYLSLRGSSEAQLVVSGGSSTWSIGTVCVRAFCVPHYLPYMPLGHARTMHMPLVPSQGESVNVLRVNQ